MPKIIKPQSSLIKDLGAESLDFLDINYRLEQTFGIKMARRSVLDHMEELFGEETAIDSDGKLTDKAAKVWPSGTTGPAMRSRPAWTWTNCPRWSRSSLLPKW